MDPIDLLCRIPPIDNIIDPLQDYVTYRNTKNVTTDHHIGHNIDPTDPNTNFDPVTCNVEQYNKLQKAKLVYSSYPEERAKFLPIMYPYELANRSIFFTRAALKLANLDIVFNLTGDRSNKQIFEQGTGYLHKRLEGNFTFCDIAGGPGSFTNYLQYRRSESMGYGITKRSHINWNIDKLDANRLIPIYGSDNSGDLYTQWKFFMDRVKRQEPDGVDLIVADGGLADDDVDLKSRQEYLTSRLLAIEIYLGIALCKVGGDFTVKTFDTVTKLTADLIYCCSVAFESVTLFKPIMSRSLNSEQYLVCKGRRSLSDNIGSMLDQALTSLINNTSDRQQPTSIFRELPQEFTNWLTNVNNKWIDRQIGYIRALVNLIAGKPVPDEFTPKIDLHQLLLELNLPGERSERTEKKF